MIQVSRLNKTPFILNSDWIETVEATPDTVILLINGKRYVVAEPVDEIVRRVVEYKRIAGFMAKTPYGGPANADNE